MIISYEMKENNGYEKWTYECPNDISAYDMMRTMYLLMLLMGYQKDSILNSMESILEENSDEQCDPDS